MEKVIEFEGLKRRRTLGFNNTQPKIIFQKLQSNFHFNNLEQIFKLPHSIVVESYVKAFQYKVINSIGQLHDSDIWLQPPEFISFLLCYLNFSIPLRIQEQ